MKLPVELATQFAKITKQEKVKNKESSTYGTIVEYNGEKYVRLDGSDLLTPASSTTNIEAGERVAVTIKNHSAVVTGNLSSPAARTEEVKKVSSDLDKVNDEIVDCYLLISDKVNTSELEAEKARIDTLVSDNVDIRVQLNVQDANIQDLTADNVTIKDQLSAAEADIGELEAENVKIAGKLEAADAEIDDLQADNVLIREGLVAAEADIGKLDAALGEFEQVVTDKFEANDAAIEDLETGKLSAKDATIKYATIDFSNIGKAAIENFYATSGLIENIVVGDGIVTGKLVGVTISGDLIEGNTIVAEKLVIKGDDGLYYKLNTDGVTTEAEQTDHNSLDGSVIKAKSITATKISVTDLVAFGATIGGFHITDSALYSGVKETVDNTTRGVYLDKTGQIAFGDANNFVKFYKVSDDLYKIIIAADQLALGGEQRDVETALDDAQTSASDAQNLADINAGRINEVNLDVDSIRNMISTLVTGQNGESLMTQTEAGWTFSIADMQNLLGQLTNHVTDLNGSMNDTGIQIDQLNKSVTDLGVYTDYIKFGIDNGKPCIILGEVDSVFKVVITNTDIRFMEGSVAPASISNQALNIETAVVNGELQQGGFAWASRSSGNYGLAWKG